MKEAIGIKYWGHRCLRGTDHIHCDLGHTTFFVWIKLLLFEAILRVTGEWNKITQGNKFSPHGNNTPRSLFMQHEGIVSLYATKKMFSDIKFQLMNLLWQGVGVS